MKTEGKAICIKECLVTVNTREYYCNFEKGRLYKYHWEMIEIYTIGKAPSYIKNGISVKNDIGKWMEMEIDKFKKHFREFI